MNRIFCAGVLALLFLAATVQATHEQDQRLRTAVYEGDATKVKALIAAGADVNAKDNDGHTALMGAAMLGHTEIAKLLIDKGADVNAKNNGGITALMFAADNDHSEMVNLLKTAGAKE